MIYGLPYQGSKYKIAEFVLRMIPKGDTLVDLFAGGCAISDCALRSRSFKHVIANDVTQSALLFKAVADGSLGIDYEHPEIVSREMFTQIVNKPQNERTLQEEAILLIWSFGSNKLHYLWDAYFNDPLKKEAMGIICGKTLQERAYHWRAYVRKHQQLLDRKKNIENKVEQAEVELREQNERVRDELCRYLAESGHSRRDIDRATNTQMSGHWFGRSKWEFPSEEQYNKIKNLCQNFPLYEYWLPSLLLLNKNTGRSEISALKRLDTLDNLEKIETLQRLSRFKTIHESTPSEMLTATQGDYQSVDIPRGGVVYADPPYINTDCGHYNGFDHQRFYEWLRSREFPVYISEYTMPEDFKVVAEIKDRKGMGHSASVEKIFVHERFYKDRQRYEQATLF